MWPYLNGSDAQVPPHQNPAVYKPGDAGVLHLEVVHHQFRDVCLPVGAQHVCQLPPRLSRLSHEVCQHPHQGILVLQCAALALLLLVLIILTVTGGSAVQQRSHGVENRTKTQKDLT